MSEYILALDIGTSAVKASLVSNGMVLVCESSVAYKTSSPEPQRFEQNPDDWWAAACEAVRALREKHARDLSVSAIGVSGHMLGLVPVDGRGEALAPSMIHADVRAWREMEYILNALGAERLYELTGNVLSPAAPLCKAIWLRDNKPDVYRSSVKFLQSKDYLNFKLTGEFAYTDYSDASHAMFLNISSKRYISEELAELGVDAAKLPELRNSTDIIGYLSCAAAKRLGLKSGIPVCAGGGDGACASVGAGIARKGDVYCSLGTTGWVACNMDKPYLDEKRRVFNILSLDGKNCGVFGTVQSVGHSIEWIRSVLGVEDIDSLNTLAEEANPGSDGLVFLPYLDGERSPIFDTLARGVFFGINSAHARAQFARSVFEGVSYALCEILDIMRERIPIDSMRVIGGGANSRLWRQILADIGLVGIREVNVSASAATSLGAAAAAGTAIGIFDGIASAAGYISQTTAVAPNPETAAIYANGKSIYHSLYPLLRPAFHAAAER